MEKTKKITNKKGRNENMVNENLIEVYTDGGMRGNIGSYGFYMSYKKYEKTFSQSMLMCNGQTIQTLELLAIIKAMMAIKNKELDVIVFTDSMSVLDNINNRRNRKYVDKMFWKQFDACREDFVTIDFQWVKSHSGNKGNEIADSLCSEKIKKAWERENERRKRYHEINKERIKRRYEPKKAKRLSMEYVDA